MTASAPGPAAVLLVADVEFLGRELPEPLVTGIRIVLIVAVAWVVNRVGRSLVRRAIERSVQPSSHDIRRRLRKATPNLLLRTSENNLRAEARGQTLITVFRSLVTFLVSFVAFVTVLEQFRISVAPLLASASVVGVALGFGAQNIVRDFLAGFFIVVEDQFGVGDVVDLGPDARGTVERVSLRSTSLRDVHGVVWHVPNGQILRVGNKSQLWARAVLDLEVSYDTDVAAAEALMREVAERLAADPEFAGLILEAPEVWGVESFTESGVAIRVVLKTEPASQFGVLRELRGRIAAAMAEAGMEFGAARSQPPREG